MEARLLHLEPRRAVAAGLDLIDGAARLGHPDGVDKLHIHGVRPVQWHCRVDRVAARWTVCTVLLEAEARQVPAGARRSLVAIGRGDVDARPGGTHALDEEVARGATAAGRERRSWCGPHAGGEARVGTLHHRRSARDDSTTLRLPVVPPP